MPLGTSVSRNLKFGEGRKSSSFIKHPLGQYRQCGGGDRDAACLVKKVEGAAERGWIGPLSGVAGARVEFCGRLRKGVKMMPMSLAFQFIKT